MAMLAGLGAAGGGGLGAIGGLVGTFFSAAGAAQQARAEAEAAEFNAKVEENNARAKRDAAAAEAEDERRKNSALRATSQANRAGSGVAPGEGTSLLVDEDLLAESELAAMRIGHGGQVEATGHENNSRLNKLRAKNARKAGKFGVASAVLGGISKFA